MGNQAAFATSSGDGRRQQRPAGLAALSQCTEGKYRSPGGAFKSASELPQKVPDA
jgi:hypothetical protein